MNVAQRIALAALVVGLLIVGGLDLLNRDTTTVSASGGGATPAAGGGSAAVVANTPTSAVAAAPAAADAATQPTTAAPAAEAVQQDDTGDEPDTVVKDDAPAPETLPGNSGTGQRIVYTVKGHRVWLVDGNNGVVRTMLVTNRKFVPNPGTYKVFGKAVHSQSKFFPEIKMDYMTRFAISPNKKNTIGFHQIPLKNGVPMQTEDQLGSYGSGGCVRMKAADAIFLFNWAAMGTKVVVLA